MRAAQLSLGLALVLVLACRAPGESVLYQATVQTAEGEVRCGHSKDPQMYVTNRLRKGDTVQVVKELDDGWLAIVPPTGSFTIDPPAGSYSWINLRFLQKNDNTSTWRVVTHDDVRVPVLVGSPFKQGKPTVIGDRLERGTQVVGIGPAVTDDEGQWLPILPPPRELRYIRKETVARVAPSVQASVPPVAAGAGPAPGGVADGAVAPVKGGPPPLTGAVDTPPALQKPPVPVAAGPLPAAAPVPGQPDPLLQQAQALEQANNWAEASQLYAQLGARYFNSNHDLAMQFYNRAEWLRQGSPGAPRNTVPSATAPDGRLRPVPAGTVPSSGTCPPSPCYPTPAYYTPQPGAAPSSAYGQTVSLRTSGPGRLRNATRFIDGRRAYLLESSQGQVLMYVTEQPGVNLEAHVDRNVELLGQIVPRGDVRPQYMTVARVVPLP